jgi:hypothetical protein
VEKITTSIRNSTFEIPRRTLLKLTNITNDTFSYSTGKNYRIERTSMSWISKWSPLGTDGRVNDSLSFFFT